MNNPMLRDKVIAFIGLGNMGASMAKNLVKYGHTVRVYDVCEKAVNHLRDAGATAGINLADAVKGADIIISMLPSGKQVKDVYLAEGDTGLLCQLPKGVLVIDCSTIAATEARKLAAVASKHGVDFVDAPVSGSTAGAASGTLTFIVGGRKEAVERARPILAYMGKNIFHAGESGAGQVAKICNNMLLGVMMVGTSEALSLGEKNGLDVKVLSDIMRQSSGSNWALEVYNPYPHVMEKVPSSKGYACGFASNIMHNDLHLALQTASDSDAKVPMASQAASLYDEHIHQHGDDDFSSIMAAYNESVMALSAEKLPAEKLASEKKKAK